MAVEAEVQESVESEWITIGGKKYEMVFVNDGPSTHEQYLRFLEFQKRRKNDKERKKV
jgi:predicted N-acyltransferase